MSVCSRGGVEGGREDPPKLDQGRHEQGGQDMEVE